MKDLGVRLARWGRRFGLEPVDLWFLGLRAATFVAGLVWLAVSPEESQPQQLTILAAFFLFSTALYCVNALHPGWLTLLYRVALVFDLSSVFFLVKMTGGFASDLFLAFVLLIALHAFSSGLVLGVATALAAGGLYALAGAWPPPMPGFALRVAFFFLVGICMGIVAEQARRQRLALERQQEQMLRSDRLATVGELAAGLAHELRNPLAGIAGALHVLEEGLHANPEARALVADLQAQIGRMNKTLSDLLTHVRPAVPRSVEVDINEVLEHSLRFLPRGNITLVRRFDTSLPLVRVDPNLLHQAFLNVLVNARQAMPHGGRLTVETRTLGNGGRPIEVRISDTGTGIAADHLGRIFQPFFTTKVQGTGLGLAIAARVIEQHGGRITVESFPGEGTTFTIALPGPRVPQRTRGVDYAVESAGC